ncbi:MAG: metalloregulator ArsR/SmtB family transcription factor [Alphaproteobacteria bacterium]|nr:metalloregulator ArsR/SmtB family transcription factor [Alphaproteobacteria bacterium]MDX5369402.1 metalloregulator ArsR/SmtB family transcription factor [Alphaproteobacteria bacterium]MDX5464085.1 metalloregulator ArsR/SmtB family transcription factor [Alphaproteobacteria bacterium]
MSDTATIDIAAFEANAAEVETMLRALANRRRLMLLCTLAERGEANVGQLCEAAGLGQSATSQHLARMREEGLVVTRREAQTIWYRIGDPRVGRLLEVLHSLYCRAD